MKVKIVSNWGCAELQDTEGNVLSADKYLVLLNGQTYRLKGYAYGFKNAGHGMGQLPTEVGFYAVHVRNGIEFVHKLPKTVIEVLRR